MQGIEARYLCARPATVTRLTATHGRNVLYAKVVTGDDRLRTAALQVAQISSGVTVPQSVNDRVVSTRKFEPAE